MRTSSGLLLASICIACILVVGGATLAILYESKEALKRSGVLLILVSFAFLVREELLGRRAERSASLAGKARNVAISRGLEGGLFADPEKQAAHDIAHHIEAEQLLKADRLKSARERNFAVHCFFAAVGEVFHGFGDLLFGVLQVFVR